MRKLLILAIALALPLTGCSSFMPSAPAANQPPIAYIDSISPDAASVGESVTFDGHGTDADGAVVAYRWRSSLDGDLSTKASFETSELSVGRHAIYFKVQDNNDAWSVEARDTIAVAAAAAGAAPVVKYFDADPEEIIPGDASTLTWDVSGAAEVSIDQGIGDIVDIGATNVSPDETTTYTLTATGPGGTVTATVEVTVLEPEELAIVFFIADPEEIISGESSTLSWEVTGATEVSIDHGIGEVDPVGDVDVSPAGDTTVTYTLTATDGTDTITAEVDVTSHLLMPTGYNVTLTVVLDESGYIRSNGQVWPKYIYAGDDNNDIGIQGFISFDISAIPADAVIALAIVDFTDRASDLGSPYTDLGCLRFYAHDYGTLDSLDYFTGTPVGPVIRYCSPAAIVVENDEDVVDALQDRVGESRFQLRAQFKDHESDEDHSNDLVRWTSSHLPLLLVSYYSYE